MSESVSHERIMTGKSWEDFCDTLKSAGVAILGDEVSQDAFERAEGFRDDNYYMRCSVSGEYEYRIRGKRGTLHYLDFAAWTSCSRPFPMPPSSRRSAIRCG